MSQNKGNDTKVMGGDNINIAIKQLDNGVQYLKRCRGSEKRNRYR